MGLVLEMVKGTSRDFELQAQNPDGTIPSDFLSSDTLTANMFAGDNQPSLFSPTTTWVDAPTAKYHVQFNDADTTSFDTAIYKLIIKVTRAGRSGVIGNISLSILPNIGVALALPVYCKIADMLMYAPWLQKLQDETSDYAGFASQRNAARTWLENIIQKHFRLNAGTGLTTFGNSVVSFGPRRLGGDNQILQGYLDQNKLMIQPPKRVIEMTAKYAIALVCQAQITNAEARGNLWQQRADWFFSEAQNLVLAYTAEVDINGDGYPEYTIACGTTDALYG